MKWPYFCAHDTDCVDSGHLCFSEITLITLSLIFIFLSVEPDADDMEEAAVRARCFSLNHLLRLTKFSKKEMRMLYQGFKQVS